MGQRNADRISLVERYNLGKTVEEMGARAWDVIAKCNKCDLVMHVDLVTIAVMAGPKTSLWNKHPKCKRVACNGRVTFWAKAPKMASHEPMVIDERAVDL